MKTPHQTSKKGLPDLPLELVLELDRRFPDRLPQTLTTQEMLLRAGERNVIKFLLAEAQRQHGVELETTRVFRNSSKAPASGDASAAASGTGSATAATVPTPGGTAENGWRDRPHKPAA